MYSVFFRKSYKHWGSSAVERLLAMQQAWVRFWLGPMIFIICMHCDFSLTTNDADTDTRISEKRAL